MANKTNTKKNAAKVAAKEITSAAELAKGINGNLTPEMIDAAAKEAVIGCHNCKDVSAKYTALVAKYGKEDAGRIQRAAKDLVNTYKVWTKEDAVNAIATLKDGGKIGRAAWRVVIEEEGNALCRKIYESCGCDLAALVVRFADYYGKVDGEDVPAVRRKDAEGNTYYIARNLVSVGGYIAALKVAVKNGKRAAIGDKTYRRKEVEIRCAE